jgi:hypothetical protein
MRLAALLGLDLPTRRAAPQLVHHLHARPRILARADRYFRCGAIALEMDLFERHVHISGVKIRARLQMLLNRPLNGG